MRIFMCPYRLTSGAQQHQLPLTFPPCVCLLVHSFFSSFALYMLGCILFCSWIPLRAHSLFYFFLAFFCMHTLACIFNFTKCICLPDVMYFFCVYLYVCILLLEVYIQGCVFIYKNAYLKRTYKKKKCIHYAAHIFLPAAAGRVFKMYTHACTFKKPARWAGHILKKCIHLPAYFFDGFMHTHAYTPFLFSQFCRHSSAAGICTEIPLPRSHRLQTYTFCTSFSS